MPNFNWNLSPIFLVMFRSSSFLGIRYTVRKFSFPTNAIFSALEKEKYNSVHFGYIFNKNKPVTESDVVTESFLFARNIETQKFENVINVTKINGESEIEFLTR